MNGIPYFCQADLRREGGWSTTFGPVAGDGVIDGTGEVAIRVQMLLDPVIRTIEPPGSCTNVIVSSIEATVT